MSPSKEARHHFRVALNCLTLFVLTLPLCHGHGIHLSKTMSITAMDLAKSAGMDEEDISAAAVFDSDGGGGSEEGEVITNETGNEAGIGIMKQIARVEEYIPSITQMAKASSNPILPLCCTMETDDVVYYQCGGGVIGSKEHLNPNEGFQRRRWTAPYKLVSTKFPTEFRLVKSVLSCQSATFSASISLNENITEGHHFYPDGTLKFENEFYRIDEYCISSIRKGKVSLQICQANCSNPLTPCIHKCCGLNEIYSFGNEDYPTGCQPVSGGTSSGGSSAVAGGIKWSPILYHNLSTQLTYSEFGQLNPHYIQRYPSHFKHRCKSQKTTVFPFGSSVADYLTMVTGKTFKSLQFRIRKDGWLLYPFRDSRGNEIPVLNRILNYCVDGAQHYGEMEDFSNHESQMVLFLCSGGVEEAFENSIVEPESDEVTASGGSSLSLPPFVSSNQGNSEGNSSLPSSAEIYMSSKAKPHVLYQLFQLHSHSMPANIVMNHGTKKLTKIKHRRPIMTLIPNHPNRTKIVTWKKIKKPKYTLPVCCPFPSDVNDGSTYHCRNRMVDFAKPENLRNSSITLKPIWKVPGFFMTNGLDSPFTLETSSLQCGAGHWQMQGFIHNLQHNGSTNSTKSPLATKSRESGILSDGYLKYENEFYRPDEFCINGLSPRIIEVQICKSNCKSKLTPCINKCCGTDEVYSLGLESGFRGCSPLAEDEPKFHPTFFRNIHLPVEDEEQALIQPHFIHKYPPGFQNRCYRRITLAFPYSEAVASRLNPPPDVLKKGPTFKSLQFRFRIDGKLMYSVSEEDGSTLTAVYDRAEYCVDLITDYGMEGPVTNQENNTILFICASHPHTSEDENYR